MIVRFAPRALADLDGIRAYLVERSPRGRERVRMAIAEAIDRCALDPKDWRQDRRAWFVSLALVCVRWQAAATASEISLRDLLSTAACRPAGDGIAIVRIIHGARVKKLGALPDG